MIQRDAGTCQGFGRTRAGVHGLKWAIGCRTALTFGACGPRSCWQWGGRWAVVIFLLGRQVADELTWVTRDITVDVECSTQEVGGTAGRKERRRMGIEWKKRGDVENESRMELG